MFIFLFVAILRLDYFAQMQKLESESLDEASLGIILSRRVTTFPESIWSRATIDPLAKNHLNFNFSLIKLLYI